MTPYRWGPQPLKDGIGFRLWAPAADAVSLEIEGAEPAPMEREAEGWWSLLRAVPVGTRYRFTIGETRVPDPASRQQQGDAQGWSVVTERRYDWRNKSWKPRPWHETVICEVHVGVAGGFRQLTETLHHYAAMGITALELMPVNDFPGERNWGYDGVLPFAPEEAYGTPEDLKRLIDEAHGHGLMVFLDVVYNHFGPDGNYLPHYASPFFRSDHKTPWGDAIDFRRKEVQSFFIENALYWLSEFRFDGLRFDAVHAMRDTDFVRLLGTTIRQAYPERYLMLENEDNGAGLLDVFDAQWNDDFHNTLHVILSGETAGYYSDFAEDSMGKLTRVLGEGFAFQGEYQDHVGRERGEASAHLPATQFISFLQNHDQIGNRALGERLISLTDAPALKAAVALQLLCPQIPMLFMGEEIGATEPFLFFTDYRDPDLAKAVREGRAAEFARFPEFSSGHITVPDPNARETFERCRIGAGDPEWRSLYRGLLNLRHTVLVPHLTQATALAVERIGDRALRARWQLDGAHLTIATNFSEHTLHSTLPAAKPFYGALRDGALLPFTTVAWIES